MSDVNAVTQAFNPLNGPTASTVVAAATASSVQVTLPTPPGGVANTPDSAPKQFSVFNQSTTVTVFVAFGTASTAVATIASGSTPGSYPVGPGQTAIISVLGNPTTAAAIGSAAGPTNVYFTPGTGK